ncbi:MAG: hypothetical protein LC792_20670 [Actinobacteria bacterium]|nr:hypothetical protein [Actinomycetota bacterium]
MSYSVWVPRLAPETGYAPSGRSAADLDGALDLARAAARELGPRGTVYLHSGADPNDVRSVTFRPDPPALLGLDADANPILDWGVEFRVVHDPTFVRQSFAVVEGGRVSKTKTETTPGPDTGHEVTRKVVGTITATEERSEPEDGG